MSDCLWLHGLQNTRLPCPSLSPGVCSNSCPLSQWCYLTISSFADPFSFCIQSFPVLRYFPTSWLFTSGKYWNFNFTISPSKENSELIYFRIEWLDLAIQGTLKSLLQQPQFKSINFFSAHPALWFNSNTHTWLLEKNIAWTIWTFVDKMMSLLLHMPSRFVIAFLPRSSCLLILWMKSPYAVILDPKKIKSVTVSTFPPSISHEVLIPDAMILVFWVLSFAPAFSFSSFILIKRILLIVSIILIQVREGSSSVYIGNIVWR